MTEETLFHEALARDPADRPAFLDAACAGRPELRAAIEALLAAHDRTGHPLDSRPPLAATEDDPAATAAHDSSSSPDAPTRTFQSASLASEGVVVAGRYTLEQRLGEGGMGEVWVTKQTEPVKRRVALKLIKLGMDSRAVLQRFEQERQALALMDHPNIARVLDAGITQDGRPFFVMELVNGLPLTRFCDELRLTPRERLQLFVPICQAVQHAHQKGVVHRDLKPANILVTMIDGRPVPKVIDFGVAKATAGKLTDASLSTHFGAVIGTLEYMSPEQAGFAGEDVDTRADIYSLGVILYELLTGLRPIDRARLERAALTEMIRIVREEEPSKPSTRLSINEALPSLAAARHTEPRKLTMLLRELDWVVMKCLEKRRDRRYETANALARDVQRYLADEPVEARPPSAGYRATKFVRRHKGQVAAAALVLLTLVGGIVGTSYGLVRARTAAEAERDARVEAQRAAEAEREAKLDAEVRRVEAERQKGRAEEREGQAIAAVKRFGDAVSRNPELKDNPALEPLRKKLLKEPLAFFRSLRERLQADGDTRPEALHRLSHAASDLGDLTYQIGDWQDALRAHDEARALHERLMQQKPDEEEYAGGLAVNLQSIGDIQIEAGRRDEARRSLEDAVALFERVARDHPDSTTFARGLASGLNSLGMLQARTGRHDEARRGLDRAREIFERLARDHPDSTDFAAAQAGNLNNLGLLLRDLGRLDDAQAAFARALEIRERLARDHPDSTEFADSLASLFSNSGTLQQRMGRLDEAIRAYERSVEILDPLLRDHPTATRLIVNLANAHYNLANAHQHKEEPEPALRSYARALELYERVARDQPDAPDIALWIAGAHAMMAGLHADMGRLDEARAGLARALEIKERVARDHPESPQYTLSLAHEHENMGLLERRAGRIDEARRSFARAVEILEGLERQHPKVPDISSALGLTLGKLADLDLRAGAAYRPADARPRLEQAVVHQRRAVDASPQSPSYAELLVSHLRVLADVHDALNNPAAAAEARRQALDVEAANPRLVALDARLDAVARGEAATDAERLELALRAYETDRFPLAVLLYTEVFAADPAPSDLRAAEEYVNAASCAVVGTVRPPARDDGLPPEGAPRARALALAWLTTALDIWTTALDSGDVRLPGQLANRELEILTRVPDLAPVRGDAIDALPDDERPPWRSLWERVERLRARATTEREPPAP